MFLHHNQATTSNSSQSSYYVGANSKFYSEGGNRNFSSRAGQQESKRPIIKYAIHIWKHVVFMKEARPFSRSLPSAFCSKLEQGHEGVNIYPFLTN